MNAISLLQKDHGEVAALFEDFEDATDDDRIPLAGQICQLLTLHALIEEELLYPAAREVLNSVDEDLIHEAGVEHASIQHLIAQIEAAETVDDVFRARVTVLGEYVNLHVEEEEAQLFPLIEETSLDLDALGRSLVARRTQLMTELGMSPDDVIEPEMAERPSRSGSAAA